MIAPSWQREECGKRGLKMIKGLNESRRTELVVELAEVANIVARVESEIRKCCTPRSPVAKAVRNAGRRLALLVQELQDMDLNDVRQRPALPTLRQGDHLLDVEELVRGTQDGRRV